MARIEVAIEATAGSSIGRLQAPGHSVAARLHHADGFPVGWGRIRGTSGITGEALPALVLMAEPALPGVDVHAWVIGALLLGDADSTELVMLCVAEQEEFTGLVDVADADGWHAGAAQWCNALDRLRRSSTVQGVSRCRRRIDAEQLLDAARREYTARHTVPSGDQR